MGTGSWETINDLGLISVPSLSYCFAVWQVLHIFFLVVFAAYHFRSFLTQKKCVLCSQTVLMYTRRGWVGKLESRDVPENHALR